MFSRLEVYKLRAHQKCWRRLRRVRFLEMIDCRVYAYVTLNQNDKHQQKEITSFMTLKSQSSDVV